MLIERGSFERQHRGFWPALVVPTPESRWFAVYVLYLDDSGEKREPFVTLAGYMARRDPWLEFERQARAMFDEAGISCLHTVDLHHRRNEFDGWNSTQTWEFAQKLYKIARPLVPVGFAFSVLRHHFEAKKKALGLKREKSAFGYCFKGMITRMAAHQPIWNKLCEQGFDLSVVLEAGNKNNPDIVRTFHDYKKRDPKRLNSIHIVDKCDLIALQLADFLAYYERRRVCRDTTAKDFYRDLKFSMTCTDLISVTDRFMSIDYHDDSDWQDDETAV